MSISRDQMMRIVERSAYLHERLSESFTPCEGEPRDHELVQKRMERWKRLAAMDDAAFFEKRLAWDGMDAERARALATAVQRKDRSSPLPAWTETLQQIVTACLSFPMEETPSLRFIDSADPVAFEHLLAPAVKSAAARLPDSSTLVAPEALAKLERHLLQWLVGVSSETIATEFDVYRSMRQALHGGWPGVVPSRKLYTEFVGKLLAGGVVDFYLEYCALARLQARIIDLWVIFIQRFVRDLETDLPDLERMHGTGTPLGRVIHVDAGLSDRHDGGTASFKVTFENGWSCIYKPKDIESEAAWYELLEWLNANGAPLPMAMYKVLVRNDHGWVEIVKHVPCTSREEVERYYIRAGMLLCLMYVLEASDCHHENMIASGEYPVLIDMETILQHRVRMVDDGSQEDAASLANRVFYWDSVFRTALLPRWEFGPSGESYDVSGLGGTEEQQTHFRRKAWKNINTDAMKLHQESIATKPHQNVVFLNEERMKPGDFIEQMTTGFANLYRFLMSRKADLPLPRLAGLRLRFLYRHTKIYSSVLGSYLQAQFLRDGMDTSIQVDVLCRPLLYHPERHPFWDLIEAEANALFQADVPIFHAAATGEALILGGGKEIPQFFAEPSFDLLQSRFARLSEQDLRVQLSYIRTSFQSSQGQQSSASSTSDSTPIPSSEELLTEALNIAREIRDAAILSNDGSATWISLAYYAEAQRWQLQPMAPRLYDGACGTVLFLAAVDKVTGSGEFRELVKGGLKSIVASFQSQAASRLLFEAGIGAGLGASSLVYSLARAGDWMQDEEVLHDALRAAELLTEERIETDRRLDLLSGVAGAMVALLTLYSLKPERWLLDRAISCGEHLLRHRTAVSSGLRAWKTLGGELLAGYSHGAAGIAHALARLFLATGDVRFREAAEEACAWELSIYSEKANNWPDFRFPVTKAGPVFQASWCHGAPGIALGRIASLAAIDNERMRLDIERALATNSAQPFGNLDHLCCGNLGRAETMLMAGQARLQEARELAGKVIARARQRGRYALGWDSGPYIPSFHQGMAGAGYQFLRLAMPGKLPSILAWE